MVGKKKIKLPVVQLFVGFCADSPGDNEDFPVVKWQFDASWGVDANCGMFCIYICWKSTDVTSKIKSEPHSEV